MTAFLRSCMALLVLAYAVSGCSKEESGEMDTPPPMKTSSSAAPPPPPPGGFPTK